MTPSALVISIAAATIALQILIVVASSFRMAPVIVLAAALASVWLVASMVVYHWRRRRFGARLVESELRYRLLAEETADLILLIRPDGCPSYVSPAVTALLGYGLDEAARTPIGDFIHLEDRENVRRQTRALSAVAPRATFTLRLRRKDGVFIWAEASLCRIEHADGKHETIVTIRNVTDRHREAEELRQAIAVARRAEAEAERASRAKTEFLAHMSHEIRTPLNSVIGFSSVLLATPDLPPSVRLHVERIQGGGNALLTVVNDILDFSQVEAGSLDLERIAFSLPSLIDECVSIVQHSASAKALSVHVNLMQRLPPSVLGDASRLRQILLNLLNNAIKFTQEGSVLLDIRYDRSREDGERLKFSVIDTGIGIDSEDRPRLFQRFAQVDASIRRTFGGTGLGLAICKRLVEMMGGEIGVVSEKNVGSTFWFTVALPPAPLVGPPSRDTTPIALGPRKILLVEDVPINQDLVRHILEASGHAVDIVCNGAEAIMAVQDMAYDVVLMDIQMPYLDGLAATRVIRALPHPARDVPIVAMTANVLPQQTDVARDAGMDDVIHKPFSAAQIFAVLARVLAPDGAAEAESAGPAVARNTLARLAGLIGEAKVRALLATLADSLAERFAADAATADGRAMLKRQAHASIAGAGMLGFEAFAATCKHLEHATEDDAFPALAAGLRRDADAVVAEARRLSGQAEPLDPGAVAA